jgi:hypothetical protein
MTKLCVGAKCQRDVNGPRLAENGLYLCFHDRDRLGHNAFEAGRVYEALAHVLTRTGRPGERVSGSSGSVGISLDPVAADERNTVRVVLAGWCRVVAEERGVHLPQDTTVGMAMYLRTHADWLARQPYASDVSAELDDAAWNSARRRLAYPSGGALFIGECPLHVLDDDRVVVCGTRLTVRPEDHGMVSCRGCGAAETVEEWQRRIVGDLGATATAAEVAALLSWRWKRPVDRDQVRQWWRDGKIERAGKDRRDRPLYLPAQVLAYAAVLWGPSSERVGA